MMFAGHETTSVTLAWAFYLLSQNPEADAKLHAELNQVLAGRAPAMSDLPSPLHAHGHRQPCGCIRGFRVSANR